MKIELLKDEKIIDTWTIMYNSPQGGKFNGKLTVTNQRLLYDAKFDVSAKGMLEETLFYKSGSEGYIVMPKKDIKNVEVKKSLLSKKVILTLKDGQQHVFNYGVMNIDKLAEAIKAK